MTKSARFAPCYAVTWVRLAELARTMGYALTLHGSMSRDLDLVAVPWTQEAVDAETLVAAIKKATGTFTIPEDEPLPKLLPHGRKAWPLHEGGGPYLDISVMPRLP